MTTAILDEEALSDALVDDDEGDLGLLSHLVVHFRERISELLDLLLDHLKSLSITDTITVDDEVGGELAIMLSCKDFNSFLERVLHFCLNNLLTLPLDDVLRVVLTHLLVGTGSEADHRGGSSVTDVNSDQHRAHAVHGLRELQVEQISLNL